MKKPNIFWRFFFRINVCIARWFGFDTIACGKRLTLVQEKWVKSLGYRPYDVLQDGMWSNQVIYIGE